MRATAASGPVFSMSNFRSSGLLRDPPKSYMVASCLRIVLDMDAQCCRGRVLQAVSHLTTLPVPPRFESLTHPGVRRCWSLRWFQAQCPKTWTQATGIQSFKAMRRRGLGLPLVTPATRNGADVGRCQRLPRQRRVLAGQGLCRKTLRKLHHPQHNQQQQVLFRHWPHIQPLRLRGSVGYPKWSMIPKKARNCGHLLQGRNPPAAVARSCSQTWPARTVEGYCLDMVVSINWVSFLWVSLNQELYYLGSALGHLIFETPSQDAFLQEAMFISS